MIGKDRHASYPSSKGSAVYGYPNREHLGGGRWVFSESYVARKIKFKILLINISKKESHTLHNMHVHRVW